MNVPYGLVPKSVGRLVAVHKVGELGRVNLCTAKVRRNPRLRREILTIIPGKELVKVSCGNFQRQQWNKPKLPQM